MERFDLKCATYEELTEYIASLGEKPFRAKQIYEWMHVKQVTSIDEMTNLSKNLRERLKEQCTFTVLKQIDVQISKQDGTRKYLFGLSDGNMIESVLMRYKHGNSVCISSQAGCRMGCRFCASTLDGLARNLTPAEMLEQIYRIGCDIGERISNVVVMGSGEPLDNYDSLLVFIQMLTDAHGLNISQRNLTVSTCGIRNTGWKSWMGMETRCRRVRRGKWFCLPSAPRSCGTSWGKTPDCIPGVASAAVPIRF